MDTQNYKLSRMKLHDILYGLNTTYLLIMGSMEIFWLVLQPFCPSNGSLKLLFTELYGIAHDLFMVHSAIVTVLFFTEICGSVLADPQYSP